MGQLTGDKARYHRKRRQKLVRREKMRALGATLAAADAPADGKNSARKKS